VSAPGITTDTYGNRCAAVHVEELDDWAWLLARLEDWLRHAADETAEDWAEFAGPGGIRLEHVTYVLSHWTVRMGNLAAGPPVPLRDDAATMTCPVCGSGFAPSGRRRYCSDTCRAAAWRRRHRPAPAPLLIPPTKPRAAVTVYECPSCDARDVETQRCGECGTFARRVGLGGHCPHCDEAVTVAELVGDDVIADHSPRRRR
jgi:hypothetical protein